MVIAKMTQLRNHREWSRTVWSKVEFRRGIMYNENWAAWEKGQPRKYRT